MPNAFEKYSDPELDRMTRDAVDLLERVPSDRELIACMCAHGMPEADARAQVSSGSGLRGFAEKFWLDVDDAKRGSADAQVRVDHCREAWARMNARGARSVGD